MSVKSCGLVLRLICAVVGLVVGTSRGATYYVSPAGSASNPGTAAEPWSMGKANSDLMPGDTAILMDGTYSTAIVPVRNGLAGNFITYRAANSRQAILTGPSYPIDLRGRSYIVIDGLKCTSANRWVYHTNGQHVTVNDCYFTNATGWEATRFRDAIGYVRVTNSYFSTQAFTDSVNIRGGDHHYVGGNIFENAGHTCLTLLAVKNSVIENNRLTNVINNEKCMEVFSRRQTYSPPDKSEYNLIQGNYFYSSGASGIQYAGNRSILRRNIYDGGNAGMNWANYGGTDPTDDPEAWWDEQNRFYNNVLYGCNRPIAAAALSRTWPLGGIYGDNVHVNNIIFNGTSARQVAFDWDSNPEHAAFFYNSVMRTAPGQDVFWWGDRPGADDYYTVAEIEAAYPSLYADNMEFDPLFADAPGDDFHLTAGSPCIDAGGPLTATTSAGGGTIVPVADALYFTDGYGLVAPDVIRIGSEKVTVASVDYAANLITIDRSITFSAGQPVYADYLGAGPDLGAFEFDAGGPGAQVVARHIFYNGCAFDGGDAAANAADDGAIATDKTALLPGATATFANYSSYWRGINGIMIDIADLAGTPTAGDFEFRLGNDNSPGAWPTAPGPVSITVRPSAGAAGSDRLTIIWADNAIEKQWLQVTVKATANTGLASPEVFYFGNAIGETGDSPVDAQVTAADETAVTNDPHSLVNGPAAIDDPCDFNRDRKAGPTDAVLVRNNLTTFLDALKLITAPAPAP